MKFLKVPVVGKRSRQNSFAPFVAGILAWLIPGAGHVYLRRSVRGIIICICINGLFWSGVALGGVFTTDPLRQRWWFTAQMCTGVSGIASWYRQEQYRRAITARLGISPVPRWVGDKQWWKKYDGELSRSGLILVFPTDVVARAYAGIAGMLNLLCIFDAVILAMLGHFGEPVKLSSTSRREDGP